MKGLTGGRFWAEWNIDINDFRNGGIMGDDKVQWLAMGIGG